MSARDLAGLQTALRVLGLRCTVEGWDALAVAVPEVGERAFEDAAWRQRAIDLARAHGFSHLAVELRDPAAAGDGSRATLPRS